MFYVNKKRAKIQNTKLRIERGTFFGQWKKYVYFSEDIGPLAAAFLTIHQIRVFGCEKFNLTAPTLELQ